uniref:Acyltransferase n=1 Tax=Erpetoichthys calabaricus TaxID=27687 RepID=A0A8C4S657_ERPCA
MSSLEKQKVCEKSKSKEFIEKISVLQWVLTFLAMGIFCTLFVVYLMFTSLWILSVIYFTWLIMDWDTPEKGGRRFSWVRRWSVWRHFRDYYPIKLVKTAELSPHKNYVLGYHPHGIMCAGAFSNFSTEATNFSVTFPGIRPYLATLAGMFKLPLYREYLMSAGMCPVSKPSLEYILSQNGTGNAVVIVTGGAAESLNCTSGLNQLVLKNRKGFVKLAVEYGADLVPVYSFGENEIFQQVIFEPGSWGRSLQTAFYKYIGFAPCIFKGKGVLLSQWGLLPFPTQIITVVGKPISVQEVKNAPKEVVDHYHKLYMDAVLELFNDYKQECGLTEQHELKII